MDTRRLLVFIAASFCFMLAWQSLGPRFFPGMFPPAVNVRQADPNVLPGEEADGQAGDGQPGNGIAANPPRGALPADVAAAGDPPEDAAGNAGPAAEVDEFSDVEDAAAEDLPDFPVQTHSIGSTDPASGYRMQVTLTSEGAAIETVALADPRYRELDDREKPLRIVGNVEDPPVRTFAVIAPELERAAGVKLRDVAWEVVPGSAGETAVAFRYPLPGGGELRKAFSLNKSEAGDPAGHLLDVSLTAIAGDGSPLAWDYWVQGPVGVPLESLDSTRTYVELKGGVVEDLADPDDVDVTKLTAAEVVDAVVSREPLPKWSADLRWVGPEVQYFAAFVLPAAGEATLESFETVRPSLVRRTETAAHSSISMLLHAEPQTVPAGGEATTAFRAYFGPKDKDMLAAIGAGGSIDFGWFGSISRLMLTVMHFFHDTVGLPYALAIMLLTCCVRLCLMPITLKVAANGERMKEMQPRIEELKEKYKDDREALGRAQMELMMKEGNPIAGCLPLLLQFPIFIGLYNALLNSVDLRLARFLWADNLAAPDHLANFGFHIPVLGEWFNLLPLIVTALFILQQKLFMPPAVSDEQAAQYKMMNFIMLFMGVMFYSVPAGLCLYFIASSTWSMTERIAIRKKWIKLPAKKVKASKPPGKFKQYLAAKMEEAQAAADAARNEGQGQLHSRRSKDDRRRVGNDRTDPRNTSARGQRGGKKQKRRRP